MNVTKLNIQGCEICEVKDENESGSPLRVLRGLIVSQSGAVTHFAYKLSEEEHATILMATKKALDPASLSYEERFGAFGTKE